MARYRGKLHLKPFAELMVKVDHMLSEMPARKRRDLIAACHQVGASNCWWAEFIAAKLLEAEFADDLRRGMRKKPPVRKDWQI